MICVSVCVMCVYCVCVCVIFMEQRICGSQNKLEELVLCFHSVGPDTQPQLSLALSMLPSEPSPGHSLHNFNLIKSCYLQMGRTEEHNIK